MNVFYIFISCACIFWCCACQESPAEENGDIDMQDVGDVSDEADTNGPPDLNNNGSNPETPECSPLCDTGEHCQEGICVREDISVAVCENEGDVCSQDTRPADGLRCVLRADNTELIPSYGLCLRACGSSEDCAPGSFCHQDPAGSGGACFLSNCTSPLLSSQECANVGGEGGLGGNCLPQENGAFYCVRAWSVEEGEACTEDQECGSGLRCLAGACEALCSTSDNTCADGKDCIPVLIDQNFGVCGEACDGLAGAQPCGEGEGCVPLNPEDGYCAAAGGVPVGEACSDENLCEPLSICTHFDERDPNTCHSFCDLRGEGSCDADEVCLSIGRGDVGGCFPGACDPFHHEDCTEPGRETCLPLQDGGGLCVASGSRGLGESCSHEINSLVDCAGGLVCSDNLGSDTSSVCSPMCRTFSSIGDYDSGCAEEEVCIFSGLEWGACKVPPAPPRMRGEVCEGSNLERQVCEDDSLCLALDSFVGHCLGFCRLYGGFEDCLEGERCYGEYFPEHPLGLCIPQN